MKWTAAELDLESSTSSSSSTSIGDMSDQDMDVSEIPLALAEGEESQALVPLTSVRSNALADEGTNSSTVSVYRPNRMASLPHTPHAHFRVMPPLPPVVPSGIVNMCPSIA